MIPCCHDAIKARRDDARQIASVVDFTVDANSSASYTAGGG